MEHGPIATAPAFDARGELRYLVGPSICRTGQEAV